MIMPGVQMPHWAPPCSRKHCWMGVKFLSFGKLRGYAFDGDDLCSFGL